MVIGLVALLLPAASAYHAAAPHHILARAHVSAVSRTPLVAMPKAMPALVNMQPQSQQQGAVVKMQEAGKKTAMEQFSAFSEAFSNLFPVWTLSVAILGLLAPGSFSGISTSYFTALLAALMLSMGITLTIDDFKRVLEKPAIMFFGFVGCYGLMPAMALGLAKVFGLSPALTAGMVLVGSINGGQASNLCTYIAKGDVALSVLMTTVTTVGAIFMTPLLCKLILVSSLPASCARARPLRAFCCAARAALRPTRHESSLHLPRPSPLD